jgi:hypothetical protein
VYTGDGLGGLVAPKVVSHLNWASLLLLLLLLPRSGIAQHRTASHNILSFYGIVACLPASSCWFMAANTDCASAVWPPMGCMRSFRPTYSRCEYFLQYKVHRHRTALRKFSIGSCCCSRSKHVRVSAVSDGRIQFVGHTTDQTT